MKPFDFLLEIGTEELPPKALRELSEALADGVLERLRKAGLAFASHQVFAAPRRLALLIRDLQDKQPDQSVEKRGPALSAAFTADGQPTKALQGFARSCGVETDVLEQISTDKGTWIIYRQLVAGRATVELLPDVVQSSINDLPIPKRMRWGSSRVEFVRPVHWIVMMADSDIIPAQILGHTAGRYTHGHRFHHPGQLFLPHAGDYETVLKQQGQVIADFQARRQLIRSQVESLAAQAGATAIIDDALLDEVTALNEWPVALMGRFEERFLSVPSEALISTMKGNQKYFHLVDAQGSMLPRFITVANINSADPQRIIEGNERVIRPRLSDAAFFYQTDCRTPLGDRVDQLDSILFQKDLGSLRARADRLARLSGQIARLLDLDAKLAERAGQLCKADLVTAMVMEFPELQGIMGQYYARNSGEPEAIAIAIEEHYRPRFSGDSLPASSVGTVVALADKLDTLTGIFGINQPPSGTKDPFALRRAALSVLRILLEKRLDLDVLALVDLAASNYQVALPAEQVRDRVTDYIFERCRAWYGDQGVPAEVFLSVQARRPTRLLEFDQRIQAVRRFIALPEAEALIAANKRVSNLLEKEAGVIPSMIESSLLQEGAEVILAQELQRLHDAIRPALQERDFTKALVALAGLRPSIDAFFDQVMVNVDDRGLRLNRLALLAQLRKLFLEVADISLLQGLSFGASTD